MLVFAVSGYVGVYPTGTASVIVAESKERAMEILLQKLSEAGLVDESPETIIFEAIDPSVESFYEQCNGDY